MFKSHPPYPLLPSHTFLIASLAEEFISLLLSSKVITGKVFLSLSFEDPSVLKSTVLVIPGHPIVQ